MSSVAPGIRKRLDHHSLMYMGAAKTAPMLIAPPTYPRQVFTTTAIHNKSNMTSISATATGSSCFGQGDGPPSLPRRSVEELTDWFSSELHSFLSTLNVYTPVPTQASNSNGLGPAHVNDHQVHSEGINTFATAIIPFSGLAVPAMVSLSLVPLHLGAGQYTPSLDQGGDRPFPPSHLSGPSQQMAHFMAVDDITVGPRYFGRAAPPGGSPIAPQSSVPRPPEVYRDYQPSGDSGVTRGPILDGIPAAVITSPRMVVYPPVSRVYSDYIVSGHPSPSSLVNSGVVTPVHISYQIEGNRLPSRPLLGQTHKDTPTLSPTAAPIRGVVDQHLSRYQCTICDAKYAWLSGLNRHYKDIHLPWIACDFCGLEFPSGRRYLLTKHLETHHPEA
ncbi:hypothetical protein EDB92DRAFT_100122 [Lactarius akahatsu]|uniref:C2H2-type domain-containing protein n=1 Tax=Lactarius akahatsu TaxID=416441 RepID=A0AAD4LTL5_9AGAM|nr:hypothetical protein EDB92DRAFT_100122 [Lactarius akahatsu]